MKKHLVSILLLCLAAMVFAQKNTGRVMISESDLDFDFNDDLTEVTINRFKYDRYDDAKKKYDGRVIEIPSKIQGATVVAIGRGAFTYKGDGISGLWIPNSVTQISAYAFESAYFSSIRLPEGLKTITTGMFISSRIKSVIIPSSVTRIRCWAFSDSAIESVSIPKGCTIEGGSTESMAAFQNCSKLKTVTFPSGRVYFDAKPIDPNNNWMWSGEGIFRECDSLTNIVIPKGFEAFYISGSDSTNYTLADYFSGAKIKTSADTLRKLRSVTVRNIAVVEESEYLAGYNKAMNSGDWEKALNYAAEYHDKYSYKRSDWLTKFNTAAANFEKTYLDEYKKAFDSKDFVKALDVTKRYMEKCTYNKSQWEKRQNEAEEERVFTLYSEFMSTNDYSLAIDFAENGKNESKYTKYDWKKLYCEAWEKPYLDVYNEAVKAKNRQSAKKVIEDFQGTISRHEDLYSLEYKWSNMLLDFDCTVYLPSYVEKLEKNGSIEQFDSGSQLRRNYNFDSNLMFKIPLTKDVYSQSKFNFTDSAGKQLWTLSYDFFLKKIKEITGKDYDIIVDYANPSICRRATADEISAYHQPRKEAVKQFMDRALKNGTVEKSGSNFVFKIYLADSLYGYKDKTFNVKHDSGNTYTMSDKDFLAYVKEVSGTEYKLYGSYYNDSSYIYRDATDEEINAYNQPRKDAVKIFMDRATNAAVIERKNSNYQFTIYLKNDEYSNGKNSFYVTDSSGNKYTLNEKDFLAYAKEVCGTEYKLYGSYYNDSSYIYRDATDEEIRAYLQPTKDAVKEFINKAENTATIEKNDSNFLAKIYLAKDSYSYSNDSFYITDSSGNNYTVSDKEFLAYAKEVCGTEYKLYGSYYNDSSYIYRDATDEEINAYNQPRKDAVKLFMDGAVKNGVLEKDDSNILFKIYLSDSTYSYNNNIFNVKDEAGNTYALNKDDFLNYAKEVYGMEYKLYTDSRNPYLYRDATDKETAAYHQLRKDAVKLFMDNASKTGIVENDGSSILFKITLDSASYKKGSFNLMDSASNPLSLSKEDFLNYAKEVYGMDYKLSTDSRNPYLYRDATDKDIASYSQRKKDAVKLYMDEAVKAATITKSGSNILFKLLLDSATYRNGTFNLKDSNGNALAINKDEFMNFANEIYGMEYKLDESNRNVCLYRSVTDKEAAEFHKARKEAVKLFMDAAIKNGTVEKDGANILFKIQLDSDSYRNGTFTLKDSNGNEFSLSSDDFFNYETELYGTDYKLSTDSRNPCLYRNATEKEKSEFHRPRKEAVKAYIDEAEKTKRVELNGQNLLSRIYLDSSTYDRYSSKFTIMDPNGNELSLDKADFLNYLNEICGTEYKVDGGSTTCMLYRNASTEEKRLYAFKNEMFHTNLAYQNKDGEWECIAEFSETEEGAVINSFKAKKSEFEKRGLKTKDVITQIELVDSDGNSSFVSADELDDIPAPSSLIFTVKRGSGKKLKELIIEVPVEWNESDIKNESNLSFVKVNDVPNMQNAQNITSKSVETDAPKLTEQKSKTTGGNDMALTFGILKPISAENLFDNSTFGLSVAWEGGNNQTIFNVLQGDFFFNEGTKIYLGYDLGVNIGPVFGLYAGGGVGVGLSGDSLSSDPDAYTFEWKANAGIRLVMKKFVCRFDASYINFYGFCAGAFVGFAW